MIKGRDVLALPKTVKKSLEHALDATLGFVPGVLGQVTGLVQSRVFGSKSERIGLPPGELVYTGERKVEHAKIALFDYGEGVLVEKEVQDIEECFPLKDQDTVTWINVDGLHDVELLQKLGDHFGLHPLVLEDVLNTDQRPKVDDHGEYLYVVLRMLSYDEGKLLVKAEQVSLVLGRNFVLSFQEREGDVFDPVRERIRKSKGRIRTRGSDYLAYALLDVIVDSYFLILERFGEAIEAMEGLVLTEPTPKLMQQLHHVKRELIILRKSVYPLRELVLGLERTESALIAPETGPFIRDVYDHTIQVIDAIETFREMVGGLFDMYLSSISNRMNSVMQMLSLIATIFIPLTFIAGIYGMNFEHMPELKMQNAYFVALGSMAAIGVGLAVYFKRKKLW